MLRSLRAAALCVASIVLSASAMAQLQLNLFVIPNPSPYLADWKGHPEYVQLTIRNPSMITFDAQLEVELRINEQLVARSKPGMPPPLTLRPGTRRLVGTEIVDMEDLTFFGSYQRIAVSTGMLPAGRYNYCVRLRNRATGQLLTQDCKIMSVTGARPPVLILPTNGSAIPHTARPLFRWTTPTPLPPRPVDYVFTLVEMLPGQRVPIDAFRTNRPILTRTVQNLTQLPLPMEIPNLDTGKTYVWSVQAIFRDTRLPAAEPDGRAEPFTFRVIRGTTPTGGGGGGSGPQDTTNRNTNVASGGTGGTGGTGGGVGGGGSRLAPRDTTSCGGCTTPTILPGGVLAGSMASGDTVRVGHFDMVLDQVTNASPGALAGTGVIRVPWLLFKLSVEFSGLKINTSKQVIDGIVRSRKDPDALTLPTLAADALTTTVSKGGAAAIDGMLKNKNKILTMVQELPQPMTTPIGINNVNGFTLAITEMIFTKHQALLAAVASIPITQYNDTLSFGVTGLPFCPGGLGRRGTLELLQDFELRGLTQSSNSFSVTLKARSDTRDGTYISWACSSFDTLSVDLDVNFPRTWLVPRPDNDPNKRVAAAFRAKATNWKNWLLTGSLEACTIPNTNGIGMEIQNLVLDISDVENAPGMVFPAGYQGDKTETFHGMSASSIRLFMPDGWRTFNDPEKAPTLAAKDLIIARTGLTGDFMVANVIQYPAADLAKMSGSVDTVAISLVNTSLTRAYMVGKINLPVTSVTTAAALTYKAMFNVAQKRFDFTIRPDNDINADLFAGARLTLFQTSIVSITLSSTQKMFDLKLNGQVAWDGGDITVPGTSRKIALNLGGRFENLGFNYDHMRKPTPQSTAGTFTFRPGTWSFASPQKSLSGFPVSISGIAFESVAASGAELCRAQLRFTLNVNLDSNRIGGSGTFRIIGAIERSTNDAKFGFKPAFKDFAVDRITVNADLAAVNVRGVLEFYNNHTKWGDGFFASIKATFKSMALELDANARFGRVSGFRYWYVEAKAILPAGIPFMTGYAFYGAGVAAWYHMNVDMTGATPSATAGASSSPSSGATMSPDRNILLGFRIMAVLGTSPDPARMNADIGIAAQFTSSGGISTMAISGSMWMMAAFADRANAPVRGTMNVSYDFVNKIFDLNASVTINRTPITGNGTLKVNVNGNTNQWYVKIGDAPANTRVNLNVNVLGFTVNSRSYLMFGNAISPPTGFLPETHNGLVAAGCSVNNSYLSAGTSAARTGPGFAAGLEVRFAKSGDINIGVGSIRWAASAGLETNVNMKLVNGTPCSGFTGYNRWYVQGNVAVYGSVSVSLYVSPWYIGGDRLPKPCCGNPFKSCFYRTCWYTSARTCIHCCSGGCNYNLASLKIGAYLAGGFPGPSWVTGSIAGNYNVLGGLVKGSFTADFSQGTRCTP